MNNVQQKGHLVPWIRIKNVKTIFVFLSYQELSLFQLERLSLPSLKDTNAKRNRKIGVLKNINYNPNKSFGLILIKYLTNPTLFRNLTKPGERV